MTDDVLLGLKADLIAHYSTRNHNVSITFYYLSYLCMSMNKNTTSLRPNANFYNWILN